MSNNAWKEVVKKQVEFGSISGLKPTDKIGKYPLAGLVFTVPCGPTGCPVTPGTTQTPVRTAKKAGGLILWLYLVSKADVTMNGKVAAAAKIGFEIGAGLNEEKELTTFSTVKNPTSGNALEIPRFEGSIDADMRFGVALAADFIVFGVRPVAASLDVVGRVHGELTATKPTSYGLKEWGGEFGWNDEPELKLTGSTLGAGVIASTNVNIGAKLKVPLLFDGTSIGYKYTWQWPKETELSEQGWVGKPVAGIHPWYNFPFLSSEPLYIPERKFTVKSLGHEANGSMLTWTFKVTSESDDLENTLYNWSKAPSGNITVSGGGRIGSGGPSNTPTCESPITAYFDDATKRTGILTITYLNTLPSAYSSKDFSINFTSNTGNGERNQSEEFTAIRTLNGNYDCAPSSFKVSELGVSYTPDRTKAIIDFKITNTDLLEKVKYEYSLGDSSSTGSGNIRSVGGCPGSYPSVNTCGGFTANDGFFEGTTNWSIDNSTTNSVDTNFHIEFCNQDNVCSGKLTYPINLAEGEGGTIDAPGEPSPSLGPDF